MDEEIAVVVVCVADRGGETWDVAERMRGEGDEDVVECDVEVDVDADVEGAIKALQALKRSAPRQPPSRLVIDRARSPCPRNVEMSC